MIYTILVEKLQEEISRQIIFEPQPFAEKELLVIKKIIKYAFQKRILSKAVIYLKDFDNFAILVRFF